MNKSDIIKEVGNILSSKKDASDAVDKVFSEISEALKRGNRVVISGFGSFKVVITKVKKGRNPKTGEEMLVPPIKKIKFKQSGDFFDKK
jgi:nucleoid DNA-binding protein